MTRPVRRPVRRRGLVEGALFNGGMVLVAVALYILVSHA